jgi:hypothetical protein
VTKGAYIKVTVKYGLIRLLSTTADLCEQAETNFNMSCPFAPGKISVTKSVDLPAVIPPVRGLVFSHPAMMLTCYKGTYTVFGDAYSDDDEQITCLEAVVNFARPGLWEEEL